MQADPQSITISGTAHSLKRTSAGDNRGEFKTADDVVSELFSHSYGRRNRRHVKITHNKVAVDPLVPANNVPHSMSVGITFDVPKVGYTVAEAKAVWDGFVNSLNAASGAVIVALLGGES